MKQVGTEHGDVIHHVAFNYYGDRLATCSADQRVKVFDQGGEDGGWRCSAQWKAHKGSVWRLDWAHPEYGSILATCSFDKTVCIWEEPGSIGEAGAAGAERSWILRSSLVDSRDSVEDVKFAPHHQGLRLATCSADGHVRFYDARDIMNLSIWNADGDFVAHAAGAACLAWNPSQFDLPAVVVGGSKSSEVAVWESADGAAGWTKTYELRGHEAPVYDVAWAPNLGRSFHLLATASKDRTVRIWKITAGNHRAEHSSSTTQQPPAPVEEIHEAARLQHSAEVWRVEWNVTGTVLATTADDGRIRLWQEGLNSWESIQEF